MKCKTDAHKARKKWIVSEKNLGHCQKQKTFTSTNRTNLRRNKKKNKTSEKKMVENAKHVIQINTHYCRCELRDVH